MLHRLRRCASTRKTHASTAVTRWAVAPGLRANSAARSSLKSRVPIRSASASCGPDHPKEPKKLMLTAALGAFLCVHPQMLGSSKGHEILQPVVATVAVDVVDMLGGQWQSPVRAFPYQPMFKNVAVAVGLRVLRKVDHPVPCDILPSAPQPVTTLWAGSVPEMVPVNKAERITTVLVPLTPRLASDWRALPAAAFTYPRRGTPSLRRADRLSASPSSAHKVIRQEARLGVLVPPLRPKHSTATAGAFSTHHLKVVSATGGNNCDLH